MGKIGNCTERKASAIKVEQIYLVEVLSSANRVERQRLGKNFYGLAFIACGCRFYCGFAQPKSIPTMVL
jgi:hypothetical protein